MVITSVHYFIRSFLVPLVPLVAGPLSLASISPHHPYARPSLPLHQPKMAGTGLQASWTLFCFLGDLGFSEGGSRLGSLLTEASL